MKSKIVAISAAALLLLAAAAWAADKPDLAGKWTVKDGDTEIKLDFKVEGAKVKGTVDNPQAGGPVEMKDGKLEGNKISFNVIRQSNGADVTINWTGTISGDEIQFKRGSADGGAAGGPGGGGMGAMMGGGPGGGPGGGGMGGMMGGGPGGGGGGATAEFDAQREKSDPPSKGAAGKWLIKDGEADIKLDLKVVDGKLTGTLDNSQVPGAIEVKEGKVSGDKVNFYVERESNGSTVKINWSGTLSSDKIHFKRESAGGGAGGGGMMGGGPGGGMGGMMGGGPGGGMGGMMGGGPGGGGPGGGMGGMMGGGPGGGAGGGATAEFTAKREKSDKPSTGAAGKWLIKDGETEIKIELKIDGSKVTGTLDNSQAAGAVEIKEGKLDGNKISFVIVRQMNDQEVKINWTGTRSGDEIKFKRESASGGGAPGGAPGGGMGGGPGGGMGGMMGGGPGGGGPGGGMGGMMGGGPGGGMGGMMGGGPGGGGQFGSSDIVAKRDKK
jgi:hypothetical protein